MPERELPKEKATNEDILNTLSYHTWKAMYQIEQELNNLGKEIKVYGSFLSFMDKMERQGSVVSRTRQATPEEDKERGGLKRPVREYKLTEDGLRKRSKASEGAPEFGLPETA